MSVVAFSPEDVFAAREVDEQVIQVVNELLVQNWDDVSYCASFSRAELLGRLQERAGFSLEAAEAAVLTDFEGVFKQKGWGVLFRGFGADAGWYFLCC